MDKREFEDKQFFALDNVNSAIGFLGGIMDTLYDVKVNIGTAKNATELLEALNDGTLEQAIRDVECAIDYMQDAHYEVDDELFEAAKEQEE